MNLEFRILGPLEAWLDGRRVSLAARRERTLLAILLVHANEVVSTDRLFDELYGDDPPRTAGSSLQNAISNLRKALGADVIATRPPGYAVDVPFDALDSARFERLVVEAPVDPAVRADVLRDALALWRGPALADFEFEPFAQGEIARLHELRLAAIEERIQADLALSRHAALVGELRSLIAAHPFRERLRAQLMMALYGAGRQADALAAYQDARRAFVDDLGIEPGPALRNLERAILRQDPAVAPPPTAPEPAPVVAPDSIERRQTVTVVFVDVVRSTRLARALDPEALREVLARYFAAVRRVVERHGGVVEKFIGDAVLGIFGLPRLHEDDALRGVRAATAVLAALDELNSELVAGWGVEIEVRIGVNTGEVVTGGEHEVLATGEPVNSAKRLQEAAEPGEILIGKTTTRLVRDAVEAEPVPLDGDQADVDEAWRVTAVTDAPAFARRLETPIIGRERELARLRQAFDQAVADNRAHLVTVVGPAGIGKTRVALEHAARLGGEATVLTGHCPAFGEALTYWPLVELLRQAGDVAGPALEAVEHGRAEEIPPVVRAVFEEIARERALVVVFEDLHWGEPLLLDLVEYLADWVDGAVALVCLARLELLEDRPAWGGGKANATTLVLEPLTELQSETLVDNLLGAATVDDAGRRRVVAAAEGNPLFVEQFLSALVLGEAGEVPSTIEALLAARLDRLGPGERSVIEVAATAGRTFSANAVAELLPSDAAATADRHLASLVRRELVRPLASPLLGEAAFSFRHSLVREAAYRATPKTRRARLHRRLADRLERDGSDQDELIGYHLEQAYRYRIELRPADDDARRLAVAAGERLGRAGIRAWQRGDTPAAVNLLGRAAALLPEGERRRELQCELGSALWTAGELERARETLTYAAAASASAGDSRLALRAETELAGIALIVDRHARAADALAVVERALPTFEAAGDHRALGRAWLLAGYVNGGLLCQNAAWKEAAERALAHYQRTGWPTWVAISFLVGALYHGATPVAEAIERCESLLGESRRRDSAADAHVQTMLAGLVAMAGQLDRARDLARRAERTFVELGQALRAADSATWIRGEIELLAGNLAEAEQALRENCERSRGMQANAPLAGRAAELADVLFQRGRLDEADEWALVSQQHAGPDDVAAQFSWRGVRAKTLAAGGAVDAATPLALEAVALVERTDALNQHAKTLLDLSAVHRAAGRVDEAEAAIEQALALYGQKGNLVAGDRTKRLLEDLIRA